jgi:3-oxoacyl-[acyl-carrier-protein] synthase-3
MAYFSISDVRLRGVSAAVPAREVHNQDLDLLNEPEAKAFVRTIGIKTRRVAPPAICASDLCVAAARHLSELTGVHAGDIGALVFVTQTPDYPLPGNSFLAQRQLGLSSSTYLLDVNQGCAGYVYGLASIASLMSAAKIEKGLLLVGDTITRLLSSKDRSTLPIFSDAGSATILERAPDAEAMHFNLGGEGEGADVICVRGGGAREPFGPDSLLMSEQEHNVARASVHLSMRGMDVLHYVLKYVAPNVRELLAYANADLETPDYYVIHQANRILNECLLKKLGIPPHKAPETLLEYGNTSCATIPVTICKCLGSELATGKKKLLLSGFGAGFSWGSALICGESILCPQLLEIEDSSAD